MFTGLVQAVGRLERRGSQLLVSGCGPLAPLQLGDSVAVDGVCLTVAALLADGFLADVSEETMERTSLAIKALRGSPVNLEPALRLSDRLGGHLVSGHVDGAGEVTAIEALPQSWRLELRWLEPGHERYICTKGSVAVDGISLTVAGMAESGRCFWIAVVPHTWRTTALHHLKVGDRVNLEVDVIARYAERLVVQKASAAAAPRQAFNSTWLAENGWS